MSKFLAIKWIVVKCRYCVIFNYIDIIGIHCKRL